MTVSVAGRYLFAAPIPGDYDIVGILCGCADLRLPAVLPADARQRDGRFLHDRASPRTKAALDAFGTLLYLVVAILFTWRLYYGMLELQHSGE